jgi:pantothenate kinase
VFHIYLRYTCNFVFQTAHISSPVVATVNKITQQSKAITFTRYSTETIVSMVTWIRRQSQSIRNFLLFLVCVTMVPGVASNSKLYRYRGHVYRKHRNPEVMSLVNMETGIHGKWHVTQATHKTYAEIATNVRLYTYMHTHIHRHPWQLACDLGHSQWPLPL